MKRLRWQILIVILALAAIAVILLTQRRAEQAAAPSASSTEVAVGPQPISGGIYTEGLIGSPSRLNPVLDFYNSVDRDVNRLIYSSLLRFDDRGLPVTDLAESWGISQDSTVYNFSIKEGARWHDGEAVTSEDVAFTAGLLSSPDLPIPEDIQAFWEDIEVKALNPQLVQFTLPEPFAPFLDYVTFGILPEHLLAEMEPEAIIDADFNLAPVGSGPYRFDRWLAEEDRIEGLVLSAFDDYYGPPGFIDQIAFLYFDSPPDALSAYQAGEILGISRISNQVLNSALAEPDLRFYTGRLPEMSILLFNLDNPEKAFLGEMEVRKALMHGLNRQRMIDTLLMGQGIIARGPILPGTWAFYDGIELPGYDPDEAIDILRSIDFIIPAEGGRIRAREGEMLAFTLLHPEDEQNAVLAQFIQQSWLQIGVDVTLEAVPYESLIDSRLSRHIYDAALVDLTLFRSPDPDPYPFWHQAQITGGQNYAAWDDRPASEYLEQARLTLDLEERTRLYRNFQVRFAQELPAIPLIHPVYTYAVDDQVQGIRMGPVFDSSDRLAQAYTWFLLEQEEN